jgi:PAS domain S-box-containing protein
LFEGAEDAQFVCDQEGRVLEANRRAQQLFGLDSKPDGLAPALLESLSRPVRAKLLDLLERKVPFTETIPSVSLLCGGRISLIADVHASALGDGFFLVTVKDASRRWRMESHVQRLGAAINATPDVFFLTDPDRRLTFVNAAFQNVTGYTIEEALGREPDFLRDIHFRAAQKESFSQAASGCDWIGEFTNLRADGSRYPVEATIAPIYDRNGALLGFVCHERDVSSKKRLAEEVLLERDFARSIVNSLDSAIYTVDREFKLTHLNQGWKKMPVHHGWLSLPEPPEHGQPLLDYVPDLAKRAELGAIFESVLGGHRVYEGQAASPDGRHWLVKVSPWQHAGEIIGLIYHVVDQTSFHQLESQLFQAQKMEIIGSVAAGVAHDFNNLLQAIRGNVSLLLSDPGFPADRRPRLEQIGQAAARATGITSQLLSFSRVSDKKTALLDLNDMIREASHFARRSLKGNIEMVLLPAPEPVQVRMDAIRASQLLLNLCVNAQDAMPNGGRLTLATELVTLTGAQAARAKAALGAKFAHCRVSDTGTGIPPDVMPRIFEAFFTTKAEGKGTGLGLSIVQRVASETGGFIDVESEVGHGTTFHVYLPAGQGSVGPPKPAVSRQHPTIGGRILVVDDLDLIREFAEAFLRAAGFEVTVAASAVQALEIINANHRRERPFDLLFTDFNMPGANGLQLIEETARRWPDIKFILASGYIDSTQEERIEAVPGVRLLRKPYEIAEAAELIQDMLSAAKPADPGLSGICAAAEPNPPVS